MTDYNRWSKFDEEEVLKSIDESDEKRKQEQRFLAASKAKQQQIDEINEENQISLEILASKVSDNAQTH